MKSSVNIALLATTLLCGSPVAANSEAQSGPGSKPDAAATNTSGEPGSHHQQLADHFVGKWNVEQTLWSAGPAPIKELGTEVGELTFAGRHVISTLTSQFSGQPYTGVSIMSYDNDKRKYYSTWVDSLSTSQFRCEGDYSSQNTTYIFHCGMNDPKNPKGAIPVRGVIRIDDSQSHTVEWYVSPDGKERLSNRSVYKRISP